MKADNLVPITDLLKFIVDNRGRSVPTVDEGFPLIATNCVKHSSIYPTFDKVRYVSEDVMKNWFRAYLEPNDILFVNKGTPGRVCLVPNPVSFCAAQDMMAFRVDENKIYYKYLFAVLRSEWIQKRITNYHVGLVIPHFKKQDLNNILIPLKSKVEQKAIGDIYVGISKKIVVNNKINEELEAMAKMLYDYWFVQFDFPDENGKPYKSSGRKMVFNEELKREIPEGWEVKTIGELAECNKWNRTKEISLECINYLDTSSLTRNVIDSVHGLDLEMDEIPSRAQRIVSENDILYSTVRPNQEHYGIIKRPIKNLLASTGFAQIRSNSKVSNDFIYQFLCQDYVTIRLQQIAEGSVSAYPSISHYDIMNLKITLPLEEKLIERANIIFSQQNENIALNMNENQKLSELRDWLLPMLMNGQVSVGAAEEKLGMVAEEKGKYNKI